MHPPRLSGAALRAVARVARTRPGALGLYRALRADLRIHELAALPESARGDVPLDTRPIQGRPPRALADANLPPPSHDGAWPRTSARLHDAYARGTISPSEVVARCLRAADDLATRWPSVGPLNGVVAEAARRDADE